jgi:ATP-binding cassette subfamily B protein
LDNENEAAVYEALDALTEGCTTFIISHDLQAIARADMIFYLENGRIVEQGDHCSLLRQGGRYAALYALETAIAR